MKGEKAIEQQDQLMSLLKIVVGLLIYIALLVLPFVIKMLFKQCTFAMCSIMLLIGIPIFEVYIL